MLRKLLSHPSAINVLKQLYDVKKPVSVSNYADGPIHILTSIGLVYVDDGQVVIALKGKQFISLFDEIRGLINGNSNSTIKMSFSLTHVEQDILLLMTREGGELPFDVLLKLSKEKDVVEDRKELLAVLKSLQDIKLIAVEKNLVSITSLGKRTITETLLESFNLR